MLLGLIQLAWVSWHGLGALGHKNCEFQAYLKKAYFLERQKHKAEGKQLAWEPSEQASWLLSCVQCTTLAYTQLKRTTQLSSGCSRPDNCGPWASSWGLVLESLPKINDKQGEKQ